MIGGFPALGDGVQPRGDGVQPTPRFAYEAYRDALARGDAPASPPFTDRPAFIALRQFFPWAGAPESARGSLGAAAWAPCCATVSRATSAR